MPVPQHRLPWPVALDLPPDVIHELGELGLPAPTVSPIYPVPSGTENRIKSKFRAAIREIQKSPVDVQEESSGRAHNVLNRILVEFRKVNVPSSDPDEVLTEVEVVANKQLSDVEAVDGRPAREGRNACWLPDRSEIEMLIGTVG